MKTLHTAYRVGNLDRSLCFYRAVGFQEVGRVPLDGGSILVMLNLPGDGDIVTLELVHDPVVGPIALGDGFSHLAVQVDDLAATLAGLDTAGVAHPGDRAAGRPSRRRRLQPPRPGRVPHRAGPVAARPPGRHDQRRLPLTAQSPPAATAKVRRWRLAYCA